jgi:membrane associated rhomboid family serine protease
MGRRHFFPHATLALLAAAGAATIAFHASGQSDWFVCYPRAPFQGYGAPLLLSLFAHGEFVHLLGNAGFLFVAGRAVERRLGAAWLLALFLVSGLAGIAAQAWVAPTGIIGASGAIAGLAVVAVALGHRDGGAWAWWVALWVAFDLFALRSAGGAGAIGHGAHVGGAAAGLAFALIASVRPGIPGKI